MLVTKQVFHKPFKTQLHFLIWSTQFLKDAECTFKMSSTQMLVFFGALFCAPSRVSLFIKILYFPSSLVPPQQTVVSVKQP